MAENFTFAKTSITGLRGCFNGFSVEVDDRNTQMYLIQYHYGKGSLSRSVPQKFYSNYPRFNRRRQFIQRTKWSSTAEKTQNNLIEAHLKETVIVLPDSDSDMEDTNIYFKNLKPKLCCDSNVIEEKYVLTLQEAFFISETLDSFQVYNDGVPLNLDDLWDLFKNTEKRFAKMYFVYKHFRDKGWVVKSGIKFGGDFLLYRTGPNSSHAEFIVIIRDEASDTYSSVSMLGLIRMAGTAAKAIMTVDLDCGAQNINEFNYTNFDLCRVKTIVCKRIPL